MERLNAAQDRLDKALTRLDGALDSLFERSGDPVAMRRELGAMVEDRARLAEELDASLARENELQALADEASVALSRAIDEVKAALGAQGG